MTTPPPFTPEPWTEQALCAEIDGDLWYPNAGGDAHAPKRICEHCPVQAECLNYALAHNERFGIWGGLTERQRRRLQRRTAA